MRTSLAHRPQGGAAVRAALIAAATELFALHGPAAVSVREIASRALVNHGLVHRHFGSKEALLAAVLAKLARDLAEDMQRSPARRRPAWKALRATRKQGTYWRILAHTLLAGRKVAEVQTEFPVIGALVQATRNGQAAGRFDPGLDPRALTATGVALALGVLMFEPYLLAATGLAAAGEKRRYRELMRVWRRLELGLRPASR